MNEEYAYSIADAWIKLILQHQPEAVYKAQLTSTQGAQDMAAALCAFRQKVATELQKHPY